MELNHFSPVKNQRLRLFPSVHRRLVTTGRGPHSDPPPKPQVRSRVLSGRQPRMSFGDTFCDTCGLPQVGMGESGVPVWGAFREGAFLLTSGGPAPDGLPPGSQAPGASFPPAPRTRPDREPGHLASSAPTCVSPGCWGARVHECVCVCVCGSVSSQSLHVQKSDVDLMRTRLRRLEEENSRKDRQIQQLLDPSRVSRGPAAVAPGCGREGAGPALRAAGGRGRPPVSSSLRLLAAGPGFCSDSGREKARCWLGEYRLQQDR